MQSDKAIIDNADLFEYSAEICPPAAATHAVEPILPGTRFTDSERVLRLDNSGKLLAGTIALQGTKSNSCHVFFLDLFSAGALLRHSSRHQERTPCCS